MFSCHLRRGHTVHSIPWTFLTWRHFNSRRLKIFGFLSSNSANGGHATGKILQGNVELLLIRRAKSASSALAALNARVWVHRITCKLKYCELHVKYFCWVYLSWIMQGSRRSFYPRCRFELWEVKKELNLGIIANPFSLCLILFHLWI